MSKFTQSVLAGAGLKSRPNCLRARYPFLWDTQTLSAVVGGVRGEGCLCSWKKTEPKIRRGRFGAWLQHFPAVRLWLQHLASLNLRPRSLHLLNGSKCTADSFSVASVNTVGSALRQKIQSLSKSNQPHRGTRESCCWPRKPVCSEDAASHRPWGSHPASSCLWVSSQRQVEAPSTPASVLVLG